jgi:carbon storage regulator
MLVLSRKRDEGLIIKTGEGDVRIVVLEAEKGRVRIGIQAPRGLTVVREELLREIEDANRQSALKDTMRLDRIVADRTEKGGI